MPDEPERIGRYGIEGVLGRGAMGVIYRAHDPVIDRTVAIKLVRADLLDGSERTDYIRRFQQEAQAAGRCAHPNIVGIYDFALHEGNPYLAMEFIDGTTLNHVRPQGERFAIGEAAEIVAQVLDGLEAAHALGVVHRDIKPANIMLTSRGRVKVTDFGISRLESSQMTGTGAVLGTPSYMAPEQVKGETVSGRSDLFSVGVVLYELVTGTRPFTGRTQHEVWNRLLNEAPEDAGALRPDAPAALLAVMRRALEKRPDDRFGTAAAMAAALRASVGAVVPEATLRSLEMDRTVLARPGAAAAAAGVQLDSAVLGTIERGLARHVGPIAGLLMKSAVRQADSVETLCRTLAEKIESADARSRFTEEMQVQLAGSLSRAGVAGGTRAGTVLAEAELVRAQGALTKYVGPVSRVLVKRAAPGAPDVATLWHRLAQHIEQPGERAAFLAQMG